MSLKDLQEDFNNIKSQLEEILNVLKNQRHNDNIEAAAAKIINEIKNIIHDCPCNKEILDVLKTGTSDRELIVLDEKFKKPLKYSYPNFSPEGEEIGTEKHFGGLSLPFDKLP